MNEALGWIGSRVDDVYGAGVGQLEDVWIDPGTGVPRWLLVKEGRFGGRTTLIPFEDAAAGPGHVWIPYERLVVHEAPEVEPGAPLTQQVESALRAHYAANAPVAVAHSSRNAPAATSAQAGPYPHQPPPEPAEAGSDPALEVPVPHPSPSATPPWPAPAGVRGRPQPTSVESGTQPPPLRPPAPPPRPPAAGYRPPQPTPGESPAFAGQPGQRPIHTVPDHPPPPASAAGQTPEPPVPEPRGPGTAPGPIPTPGRRAGAAPSSPEGTLALPRVDALDQSYWIEVELEGGAKISGPVRGLLITPMRPDTGSPGGGSRNDG